MIRDYAEMLGLLLFVFAPLLCAVDAFTISTSRWASSGRRRGRWIAALLISFLIPPTGVLVSMVYPFIRPRFITSGD